MNEKPWDICECGDYRDDHEYGLGPCRFGAEHVPRIRCIKFVFSRSYEKDRIDWIDGHLDRDVATLVIAEKG